MKSGKLGIVSLNGLLCLQTGNKKRRMLDLFNLREIGTGGTSRGGPGQGYRST